MRLIITILAFLILLGSQASAQLTEDELKKLPAEKIIIYAKMGDVEAQYWLANAIRSGAIPNWRDLFSPYEFLEFYENAANQGHGLAAYKLGAYLRSRFAFDHLDEDKAIRFLKIAVQNGVPEAHLELYYLYNHPSDKNFENKLLAGVHLEKAVKAGIAPAMSELALAKTHGYANMLLLDNDVPKGIELFTRSWSTPRSRFETIADANLRICNDILSVAEIFDPETQYERFRGLKNLDTFLEYLELGASYNCPTIMYRYADHVFENENLASQPEKLREVWILASKAASAPSDHFWAHRHYLLAQISWEVGDLQSYKKSLRLIIENDPSWDDMTEYLLKTTQEDNEAGACINEGLRSVGCQKYLQ